jgi:cell division protein FtsB
MREPTPSRSNSDRIRGRNGGVLGWRLGLLVAALALTLIALQYRLWVGEGSRAEVQQLARQIERQQVELTELRQRNQALRAEVEDLKAGLGAVETRARRELGMIRDGETFFQVVEPDGQR